jgi:hypothetical protein
VQELTNQLARRLGIKQIEIPFGLHERLLMIKYVAFCGIWHLAALDHHRIPVRRSRAVQTAITMKFCGVVVRCLRGNFAVRRAVHERFYRYLARSARHWRSRHGCACSIG